MLEANILIYFKVHRVGGRGRGGQEGSKKLGLGAEGGDTKLQPHDWLGLKKKGSHEHTWCWGTDDICKVL